MKTISMKTGLAAALAAAAAIATPAVAADEGQTSVSVSYSDLNLATPEGQAALERRLDRAAREVCRIDDIQVGTRIRSRSAQQCYEATVKQLEREIAALVAGERAAG